MREHTGQVLIWKWKHFTVPMTNSFLFRLSPAMEKSGHQVTRDQIPEKVHEPFGGRTAAHGQGGSGQRARSIIERSPVKNVLSSPLSAVSDNRSAERLSNGITTDTPLRLVDIVRLGFPAGGMTVSGLRREINRGRLNVELIAGKQFTTLANIERMREKCRVVAKAHDSGNDRRGEKTVAASPRQFGSSKIAAGTS